MDQKRSEEVKNTRQDTEKDQAQSSSTVKPIAKVVSRLRGKKGGVNSIENQNLRVFFSQSSLSSFENSIVQFFDNRVKDLSFEKLGILISEKERELIRKTDMLNDTVVSIWDSIRNRYIYMLNVDTLESRPIYQSIRMCLDNLKKVVEKNNDEVIAIPKSEINSKEFSWPTLLRIVVNVFHLSKLDLIFIV